MQEGHAAGLEAFIYGKAAAIRIGDTFLISAAAAICIGVLLLQFKQLKLLCFDEAFAGAQGLPVLLLDFLLMALVVMICIVGLQAVGLILMIAMLVIPAAAARFWTERMGRMMVISGGIGAASGLLGAGASALLSKLPSGAMIVLVCAAVFLLSMVFGPTRGVLARWMRRIRLNRTVDRQHLLRGMFELLEEDDLNPPPLDQYSQRAASAAVRMDRLLAQRSWSPRRLLRAIRKSQQDRLVTETEGGVRLTAAGRVEAARLTRQHRLWELYLITHAEVAPSRVDRAADAIEHVLEPEVVAELESLLDRQPSIPASPHALTQSADHGSTHATPASSLDPPSAQEP